ncbi:response regulator [Natrarchaeobius halalkaliphilus]|uniref:Response regulator n=1 Tax=Natrarchaeobius halalkaliphilus TaxID=1679091 RepID=A0A3N6LMP6_9EURY|nr:response regulator [Natrarchaeobius halalkaliphilus]RQG90368.1 response regulator [Natrarchaeobius halalkaliphilus]
MNSRIEAPIDILLVEDNPGDARLTEEAFEAHSNEVTLSVTTSGDEALEVLRKRRDEDPATVPDLVLLDLNMPGMDGFEFLRTIKADSAFTRLPVLVLTSSTASEDVLESYELAANAYLTKPTDPDEYAAIADAVVAFWFERASLPSSVP